MPKAAAQRPTVWGSRSSTSAVAAAVQPWARSSMAYHRSRSRGVGARIIRRRKSLTPICHCSRDRSISLTPIINPLGHPQKLARKTNLVPTSIYPIPLRIPPWLWFRSKFCNLWVIRPEDCHRITGGDRNRHRVGRGRHSHGIRRLPQARSRAGFWRYP